MLASNLLDLLNKYDQEKGFFRKLFRSRTHEIKQLFALYASLSAEEKQQSLSDKIINKITIICSEHKKNPPRKTTEILGLLQAQLNLEISINDIADKITSTLSAPNILSVTIETAHKFSVPVFPTPYFTTATLSNRLTTSWDASQSNDLIRLNVPVMDMPKLPHTQLHKRDIQFTPATRRDASVAIESNIHLIWIGSMLRPSHQKKIQQWQDKNINFTLTIWYDEKRISENEKQEMVNFCHKNGLMLKDIQALKNEETETLFEWIEEIYSCSNIGDAYTNNYGVVSDIVRYPIISQYGGWYFDTDILPVELAVMKPYLGFYIKIDHADFTGYTPAIFAAIKNSSYCSKTIENLKSLSVSPHRKILSQRLTLLKDQSYITATMAVTGYIGGILACEKLQVDREDLIVKYEAHKMLTEEFFHEIRLPDRIKFKDVATNREKSWYADVDAKLSNDELAQRGDGLEKEQMLYLLAPSEITQHCLEKIPATPITVPCFDNKTKNRYAHHS